MDDPSEGEETFDLEDAVGRLVRGGWDEIESSIFIHGEAEVLRGTMATVRCHFIRADPSGRPRLDVLARQLADQLVHYCIPRSELETIRNLEWSRQASAISRLARESARLFTQTQVQTGEGSELLLYVLLEKHLSIPQVLSKMALKTNTEVQIHGADGVHAKLLDNGDLALYWGEAKMYDSVSDAMTSCLDSLAPYLTGTAYEQDVFLIKHFADTGNEELTARLLEYFDDGSMLSANVEMRGGCLIGFSHDDYPSLPRTLADIEDSLNETVTSWSKSMKTRITNRSLNDFVLEVFLVPVPSAEDFRGAVKAAIGLPTK